MKFTLPHSGKSFLMFFSKKKALKLLCFLFILLCFNSSFAQKKITGRIVSGDSSLQGVTVSVKGTTNSTQTDQNGRFSISASPNATLVVTSIGYIMQEVPVNNRSSVNIKLSSSTQQLNEVVVVGYGVQKKVTVTGAVATVKGTELQKSPAVNLSNSLAGRLPGVIAMNGSGEPGYDGSTIRIGVLIL